VTALVSLGFTQLEAEVYHFLLGESPATGYRAAQALGRPVANTYKAIEALAAKGAVLVDDGTSRLCRAVPWEELLGQLDRSFAERKEHAAAALARLGGAGEDNRVYQLKSREQALERCRAMLARAQKVALVDVFPVALEELRADMERAAGRGVRVVAKTYAPADIPGVRVILNPNPEKVTSMYPGQWTVLFIDGAEYLLAALTPDGQDLLQAVWSGSPFLSWVLYTSVSAEFVLAEALTGAGPGAREAVRRVLAQFPEVFTADLPGHEALIEQMGGARGSGAGSNEQA
jgi:sugar-specific transcriptional regulator TrmB